MRGAPYLQLSNAGPLTYVRLPAGKYRINARFHGKSETHEVTLDRDTCRDVYFRWKTTGQRRATGDGSAAASRSLNITE
jgi:hypothetical protein